MGRSSPDAGHSSERRRAEPVRLIDIFALVGYCCSRTRSSYAALEKSGKADRLAETAGYSSTLFFSDDDIKVAIEELARSTEAISKQTEALRQQQDALKRLVGSSSKGGESRSSLESKRLAKWETDRKALTSVVCCCF